METVTVSSKYQIVLPSEIRKLIGIKPGSKFWALYDSGSIRLIPKKKISELFGTLKGMDTSIERDEEDRI